jgi:hypothetical protein
VVSNNQRSIRLAEARWRLICGEKYEGKLITPSNTALAMHERTASDRESVTQSIQEMRCRQRSLKFPAVVQKTMTRVRCHIFDASTLAMIHLRLDQRSLKHPQR